MARPKKNPADLKKKRLVVLVTAEQHEEIVKACSGLDVSEWARPILLGYARGEMDLPDRPKVNVTVRSHPADMGLCERCRRVGKVRGCKDCGRKP